MHISTQKRPQRRLSAEQSIVIETKAGAMVEIYNSPNSYGGVKTWEIGGGLGERESVRERGSPCPCATSSDSQAQASSKPKERR